MTMNALDRLINVKSIISNSEMSNEDKEWCIDAINDIIFLYKIAEDVEYSNDVGFAQYQSRRDV